MIGPYRIVAQGNPHAGGIRWHIQHKNGTLSQANYATAHEAERIAALWAEQDWLDKYKGE